MLSSLLVIFCTISQMIVNTSCMHRAQYAFDQAAENIQTIEIVEAYYDHDTTFGSQKVLVNIDDIDYFIKRIKDVKYTESNFSKLGGIDRRSLCIKVLYDNGDYELFDYANKTTVYANKSYYKGRISGLFEQEDFYALIWEYLNTVEGCQYSFYHNVEEISSIEIVNSSIMGDYSMACESLSIVEDVEKFIDQLNHIQYTYTNHSEYQARLNQKQAIKISYKNGDYEVFTYNHRDEVELLDAGTERAAFGTYIGTFDEKAFNKLVSQYLPNETTQ